MKPQRKEIQAKLMKGLLDLVILQFLKSQPMHGYQIITKIRKNFGVYFGPSTIYPLLNTLEERGFVKSEWDLSNDRPKKVYTLTTEGKNLLSFTEDSLNHICRKLENIGANKFVIDTHPKPLYPTIKEREKPKNTNKNLTTSSFTT